jgi:hypothetical protein
MILNLYEKLEVLGSALHPLRRCRESACFLAVRNFYFQVLFAAMCIPAMYRLDVNLYELHQHD